MQTGAQDPLGAWTTYQFNAAGGQTLRIDARDCPTAYTLDALDRESRKVYGNGIKRRKVMTPLGRRPLSRTSPRPERHCPGTCSYYPAGNRLNNIELDGAGVTWAYDPNYQLTIERRSGANGYNTTYLYDGVGNRTVKNDSGSLTS